MANRIDYVGTLRQRSHRITTPTMKTHLIFLLCLLAFIALFALTLLGYLAYSLCGEVYDEITGQWKRSKNAVRQ